MVAVHRLPAPAGALIGRAGELEAITELLESERLVTLTGPPGVGKTRLALAVAVRFDDHERVRWVDLAPVRDAGLVVPEVMHALDGSNAGRTAAHRGVTAEPLLLVLDNCEHVLDAAGRIADLLEATPRLHVLATSRERLHLAGEREIAVPPLPMPSHADLADVDRLRRNPSVALLLARSGGHLTLTTRTAQAVADVCVRLDGLPLALELAAARLRVFTPAELAFRLEHRFTVLTGGARDVPARHRDLRAALDWSHGLLPSAEQAALRRLAVLRGPWALPAAATVTALPDILDAVESLLDKSLLRRVDDDPGGARFDMLMSVREFAHEQLSRHNEVGETYERHAAYFAGLAGAWEADIGSERESTAWRELGAARADLQDAYEFSRSSGNAEPVLRLASALAWYGYTRGALADSGRLLDQIEQLLARVNVPADVERAARLAAGVLAFGAKDLDRARHHLDAVHEAGARHGDERRRAVAHAFLGHVARQSCRLDDAVDHYAAAKRIFEQSGDRRGVAWAAHDLGLLAEDRDDHAVAALAFDEALRLFEALDYEWAVAVSAGGLARALLAQDLVEDATHLLDRALTLHEQVGDMRGIGQTLDTLAEVAASQAAYATAARLLGAATARRAATNGPSGVSSEGAADATVGSAEARRRRVLEVRVAQALGAAAADHERQAGRTMPAAAALDLAHRIARPDRPEVADAALTPRQLEVAALVAASNTNRQIGKALGISEKTAEIHVRNIMDRLHTTSRAGIAAWIVARGAPPVPSAVPAP